jgi:teichuronic acid exporter
VMGSSLLGFAYNNADYLIVGKLLGSAPLGFYTIAFRLATLINDRISGVINRVAFPSFAALKEDPPQMVDHWFAVTKRVSLITFPILVWLAVDARDFVVLVLGRQWEPATTLLRCFCFMTVVRILSNVVGQILTAAGHPRVVFHYDVVNAIVLPISFIVGCKLGGILGVGIAWCTVYPAARVAFMISAKSYLPFDLGGYAKNLQSSIMISALVAVVMAPGLFFLQSGWPRLVITSSAALVAFVAVVFLTPSLRRIVQDLFQRKIA